MTPDAYSPIPCSDYDMLEIACMHRYRVRLRTSTAIYSGTAIDLRVENHEEFLVLQVDADREQAIRIDRIQQMTVLSEPRSFDEHRFEATADRG